MSFYMVEKIADAISKTDVLELFGRLEKKIGSISEVCRKAGIERKTFYHWKEAKEIKKETKVKLLELSLEVMPEETFEFLIDKLLGLSRELLSSLLQLIFERAISEPNGLEYYLMFHRILKKYGSMNLLEPMQKEIERMLMKLNKRFKASHIHEQKEIEIEFNGRVSIEPSNFIDTASNIPSTKISFIQGEY